MFGKKLHLLCCFFFLIVGVFDFLYKPTTLNDRHRQLLTDISSHRGYGTHYVSLMVGSPPQLLRLAVATGSDYIAFPCQGCYTCHEPHFQYSVDSMHQCPNECLFPESTCRDGHDGCHIVVQYSSSDDLSGAGYRGVEVTDYVYADMSIDLTEHTDLATKEAFPLHFICQEDAIGDIVQADGYLGMSTAPLSYINQIYAAGKIEHKMFSLCFQDYDNYQSFGASAGHVTFGHVDRDLLDSQLVWAANKASTESLNSYAVHVRRVYLGMGGAPNYLQSASMGTMTMVPIGNQTGTAGFEYATMNGESGDVLIQTNQPVSYMHESIEKAFKKEFFEITGMRYTVPAFKMTEKAFQNLPTVFIQIEANKASQGNTIAADLIPGFAGRHDHEHPYDILLAVPPEHYIIHLDGIAFPTLRFGSTPRIASNLLQNHELVFDLDHNRIGFAQRNHCPEGMSMTTPLASSAPSPRPQVRGIDVPVPQGKEGSHPGRPLEGITRPSDGQVVISEDHDFVAVTSDAEFSPNTAVDNTQIVPGARADAPPNQSSSNARTIGGSTDTTQEGNSDNNRPVEGVSSSGEVMGNSEAYTPDAFNENSGSGRSKGRIIGGGSSQTTADENLVSGSENGLSQEQDVSGSSQATNAGDVDQNGSGNGIHGELDGAGASIGDLDDGVSASSGRNKGRIFGGSDNEDTEIPDNLQPGVSTDEMVSRSGEDSGPFEEQQDGLPNATITVGVQALRIGPGAVNAAEALVNTQYNGGEYDFMNVLGLAVFFLGFALTVFFTQDNYGSVYTYVPRSEVQPGDATNDARAAWSKGESFYNKSGSQKFKKQKSFRLKRGVSKKWFGKRRDSSSATTSGLGSSRAKWSGNYSDDQSQYASDDRTTYTSADRTQYSQKNEVPYYDSQKNERPYYDRSQSANDTSDKSANGSFYQAYSESDAMTAGSRRDDSTYYDRSKSSRSIYSQSKSSRSIYSQDDASYDIPLKPHDEDVDNPKRSNQLRNAEKSVRSFYSAEDAVYYPRKQNPSKFIKPVNSDDRSVFTRETSSSGSMLSREASARSGYSHSDHSESHSGSGTVPQGGRYYEEAPYGDYNDDRSRSVGTYYSEAQHSSSRGDIYHDETSRKDSDEGTYYDEEPRSASEGHTYYEDHGVHYQDSPYDFDEEATRGTARDRSIRSSKSYAGGRIYEGSGSRIGDPTRADTINDGDSYSGIQSFADDSATEVPEPSQPMSQLDEADEYGDVDSFYVDEASLSPRKLPRRNN